MASVDYYSKFSESLDLLRITANVKYESYLLWHAKAAFRSLACFKNITVISRYNSSMHAQTALRTSMHTQTAYVHICIHE